MENLAEAPRVSHFLASNQDECLLGDTMSSVHAALKSTGAARLW